MTGTVVVTGGCGYLGSELIRQLSQSLDPSKSTIRVFDNLTNRGHRALMDLPGPTEVQFVEGDLFDPGALRFALSDADWVVHLAGITRTPFSFDRPTWLEQVNRWGTARVVDLSLEAGVRGFVYASTAAVYGPGGPFSETDTCRPIGAYAESKLAAEEIVLSAGERGLTSVVLRLGTLFGVAPVMRFDAVVNRFAYLAGVGRPVTVFGKGDQRRPNIHVRDAARLVREVISAPLDESTVLNVAVENPSVNDLVSTLTTIEPGVRVQFTEQDALNFLSLETDHNRLLSTGFEPQFTIADGLAEVIERFDGMVPALYPSLDD